ncbi:MAG: hypothetical protein ACKOEX_02455 [Planctomycetia bacterium]
MTRRMAGSLVVTLGWLATAASAGQTPYVQTSVIEPVGGQGVLLGFCVPPCGGLVAITGMREQFGPAPRRAGEDKANAHRVVWFDADGAEARSVDLDFAATVIAACPDGGIFVAGDGVVVLLSAAGKEVARGATPQAVKTDEDRAELEKTVLERRDMQVAGYEKHIERLRATVAELEENVKKAERAIAEEANATPAEESNEKDPEADDKRARELRKIQESRLRTARTQATRTSQQLKQMEAQAEAVQRQDPRLLVEQAIRRTRQVRAISATRDAVFIVVAESSGYGYSAWRLDPRLENPEKILEKLVGCCSQMDVQVIGNRLAIAANRKHCVELCSFEGEALGTVGKRAAAGDDGAGFGGCCNPMNTCPGPDGDLLTSESDGVVKRFDADGGFVEVVGKAAVRAGCKNSAIAIEPDGSRLYYMDSTSGKVLVLTRSEDHGNADDGDAPNRKE